MGMVLNTGMVFELHQNEEEEEDQDLRPNLDRVFFYFEKVDDDFFGIVVLIFVCFNSSDCSSDDSFSNGEMGGFYGKKSVFDLCFLFCFEFC